MRGRAKPQPKSWFAWEPGQGWANLFGPRGEPLLLVVLAIAVGVVGGLGAVVFRRWLAWSTSLFDAALPGRARLLGPTIGLLLVGAVVRYLQPEVKGDGVPQALEALAIKGGRIRAPVALWGIVTPAITLGSGGSAGQEGPMALIGAAFGSVLGQLLRLPTRYLGLLLACGAGAGIAATFNAPMAGAFFALEVMLGSYAMGAMVPALVAAVVGAATFTLIMGPGPVLPAPPYVLVHPGLLAAVLVFGAVAGLVGVAFTRGLSWLEEQAEERRLPFAAVAGAGGLVVGAIGLAYPQVLGVGYETVEQAIRGQLPLRLMAGLLVAKYVATLVTIGSGGSGGTFAPSVYLGAMLGGVYGALLSHMPGLGATPGLFAMVGTGAVFAGAAQAPLTAIAMVLEMSGEWGLTLGVIAACAISYLVHGSLLRDSMYTVRLSRRGVVIVRGSEVRPTERIPVSSAMAPVGVTVRGDCSIEAVYRQLLQGGHEPLMVVDDDGRLIGVVSLSDLQTLAPSSSGSQPVQTVARTGVVTVYPDETLDQAMRRFAVYDFAMLPVVSREDPRRPVGRLRRSDVLKAYHAFTLHSFETSVRINFLREVHGDRGAFKEVVVLERSPLAGRRLMEVRLPSECVVVSVTRGDQVLVPHGSTEIRPGDRLLVFAVPARQVDDVASWLAGTATGKGLPASLGARAPSEAASGGGAG